MQAIRAVVLHLILPKLCHQLEHELVVQRLDVVKEEAIEVETFFFIDDPWHRCISKDPVQDVFNQSVSSVQIASIDKRFDAVTCHGSDRIDDICQDLREIIDTIQVTKWRRL